MNASAPLPSDDKATDLVQEELVSYLDGELDAVAVADVERRLAEDEEYRCRLQSLQQAWDMLDYLPKSEMGEAFSRTTVEMVAVTAAGEVEEEQVTLSTRRIGTWLAVGGGATVTTLLGFFLVFWYVSQPNRQLVEDLPVIEYVDAYRNAESLEFLQTLDQEGIFAEEGDDAT